ncbi:MAG: PAS domain S-box protein [Deltaproteobacteria bacterium]|nr:PAS domain S-box protein [Deltaproteobacteria bacterium]
MDEKTIISLRQMDKEALVRQIIDLHSENEALQARLSAGSGAEDEACILARLKSEERFRVFAENVQAAVYMIDGDARIVYANPFMARLSGYSQAELLRMPIFDLVHPDYRETAIERTLARFRGEVPPANYDIKLQVKAGEIKCVELYAEKLDFQGEEIILGTAIDITARKKSEEALREREEMFRAFTENVQVMVYTYNSKGFFTYANKICEDMTGYTRDELLGMHFTQVLRDDYKDLSVKRAELRRSGEHLGVVYDVVGVKKDGTQRWWELSGIRLEGKDDDVTVLGSAIDITARVESEQALKESEEKFRSLYERSSDPMLLLDEKGFFDCNPATVRQLKAKNREAVIAHPARLSPELQPDGRLSQEKAEALIKEAYAAGFLRFEWLHCDLAGGQFWADVSLTVIPFQQRKILFTVWRDITLFKKLEHHLRDEREQLLVTLRSIGDAVITTDLAGRVVLMNRVAEKLTGWRHSEASGRHISEILKLVNGKSGAPALNPLARAITEGMILELADNTVLHSRSGQEFKIADSASPIRDEKSQIIGGVLVFRDISERERMQEEVLKLRKLESVGRLAGGIAHDFNNLLTGIMGNIEVAMMRLGAESKRSRENLNKALKASRRAADLTQKLLTFAKGGEPVKEAAAIAEIIKDSAEFSLTGSKIALSLALAADLWAAEVDAGQISQVIQNLVINAVHAMPDGGTILITAENVEIALSQTSGLSLKPGPYVKILVRDQGLGIAEDLRDKIFDPFFTTKSEGSGLGLSVIHSIVNKHQGCVRVASEPGVFTEFTVFLPALGIASEKIVQKFSREPDAVKPARILVMDDEEIVREIISELLQAYGYEVVTVSDGQQVLAAYSAQPFDLVIMDLTVPGGMGGLETLALLQEIDPKVKAVVSSGYANDPVVADYGRYGFCGFLHKPYIIEDLLQLLKRNLDK